MSRERHAFFAGAGGDARSMGAKASTVVDLAAAFARRGGATAVRPESDDQLLRRALGGDETALSALVARLTPVIQARVARCLLRRAGAAGSRLRQDVKDLVQEVFVALFEGRGRILLGWDPRRGLSLDNFVGLVAERQA